MKNKTDRRSFIKSIGFMGATLPMIVNYNKVFGKDAPSKKVNVGLIGCGGRGTAHWIQGYKTVKNCNVVSVCDAKPWLAKTMAKNIDEFYNNGSKVKIVEDYREMLADDNIDAISIAAHDHWHAPMTIAAAQAGKNVYCEKSLSVSMDWSYRLRQAVNASGIVFQFGTQQRAIEIFKRQVELVRNGYLGNIKRVFNICPDVRQQLAIAMNLKDEKNSKKPADFNYDMWLGVAPLAEYSDRRVSPFGGYHIYDYALGFISNWGIHCLDVMQWGLNMDNSGPVRCEGIGKICQPEFFNTCFDWDLEYTYANGVKGIYSTDLNMDNLKKRYPQARSGMVMFEGDEGWIVTDRDSNIIEYSSDKLKNIKLKPSDWRASQDKANIWQNFVDCCLSGAKTQAPVEGAIRSDSLCHMANVAIRSNSAVEWDTKLERPKSDKQFAMMNRKMREKYAV